MYANTVYFIRLCTDLRVLLDTCVCTRAFPASYLCMPYLLAQQCKVDRPAADAARVLFNIHQKDATKFTAETIWDSVEKSFRIFTSTEDLPLEVRLPACLHVCLLVCRNIVEMLNPVSSLATSCDKNRLSTGLSVFSP